MKVLKIILIIAGIALIAVSLYNSFAPEPIFKLGPIEVDKKEGLTGENLWMLAIGVVALLAGALIKEK